MYEIIGFFFLAGKRKLEKDIKTLIMKIELVMKKYYTLQLSI